MAALCYRRLAPALAAPTGPCPARLALLCRPVLRSNSPSRGSRRSRAAPLSVSSIPDAAPGEVGGSGGGERGAPDTASPAVLQRAWDALLDQLAEERSAKAKALLELEAAALKLKAAKDGTAQLLDQLEGERSAKTQALLELGAAAAKLKAAESSAAEARARADAAEHGLEEERKQARALDAALSAVLAVGAKDAKPNRARMVAALLEAAAQHSKALPDNAASSLVELVAEELGATVIPDADADLNQPAAMQLVTLKAVDQALRKTSNQLQQVRRVKGALVAQYGGLWSCVKGWEAFWVEPEPGTYMAVKMRGEDFVVFQGRSRSV